MTTQEQLRAALAVLAAPAAEATVQRWIERSQTDLDNGRDAVLIERRVAGQRIWYGVGLSESAVRRLHEEVTAFVGPTYAAIDPPVTSRALVDAQEAAVLEIPQAAIFRIRTSTPVDGEQTDRQLETLRTVQARRPPRDRMRQRPASLIIRDLDAATAAGQLTRMRQLLVELRRCGTLSNVNLECLEIRTLAAESAWGEILSRPGIDDLVSLRLPRDASATLIEAVYRVYIEPEERSPPAEVLALFRDRVLPRFGRLFRAPQTALTSATRRAWLLFALSSTPPAESLRRELLEAPGLPSEDRAFLEALSRALESSEPPKPDLSAAVAALLEQGQFTEAWTMAQADAQQDHRWRTRVLLHCAYETGNPEWAAEALAILDATDDPTWLGMRTVRSQVESLRELVTARLEPINNWASWLHALATEERTGVLVSLARENAGAWDASEAIRVPEAADALLEIATGAEARTDALRDVRPLMLPQLLAGYESATGGSGATTFLLYLVQTVCTDKRIGPPDLEAAFALAEALMGSGLSAEEYCILLSNCLLSAWKRVTSPRSAGWLGDVLHLLSHEQCPDESCRAAFVAETVATLGGFAHALPDEHRIALHEAYAQLGEGEVLDPIATRGGVEEAVEWAALEHRRIFIYTLVEQAGVRARDYLCAREPTAAVEVWSEHDAERRMLDAATAADLVVIATRAAKHAATEAIERAVIPRDAIVYPSGKGWSSIVSAVREELPRFAS